MPLRTLTCMFFLLAIAMASAATASPSELNCKLDRPPASAGEVIDHDLTLRIYPRASDIDASYSGCQTLWAPDEGAWLMVSRVLIEKGAPVRAWSPEEAGALNCRYAGNRLVEGEPSQCPAADFLILKSFPPGCAEKLKASM